MSEMPENVLAALPKSGKYGDLSVFVSTCLSNIRRSSVEGIWWRWAIGKAVIFHSEHPDHIGGYADRTVDKLSASHGIDESEFYRYIQFARQFPDQTMVEECLRRLSGMAGYSLSWSNVRKFALPDPAKDDTVLGSPKKTADHFSGILEAHVTRMEQYVENGVPESLREEVAGSLVRTAEVTLQLAKRLTQDVEIDTRAFGARIPDTDPERYAVWVRTFPCLCCGNSQSEAAHFPFSKGAGGSDRHLIPLCYEHHQEQHTAGRDTFLARWMPQIFTWLHSFVWAYYTERSVSD